MKEVLLRVLVDPERDNVQHARLGDLFDPRQRFGHRGLAVVVAEERKRRLPGDAVDQALGIAHHVVGIAPGPLEEGQNLIVCFAARKHACEKAQLLGACGQGGRAAKRKADAGGVQVVGRFSEVGQQPLARFGRQPVRDTYEFGVMLARGGDDSFDRRCRS